MSDLQADYTDPNVIRILGWDEQKHGAWDKTRQRYDDGTKEWVPAHELVYTYPDVTRCECGELFYTLAEWVQHERERS